MCLMQSLNNITNPFDVDDFFEIQDRVIKNINIKISCLGKIDSYPLNLITPKIIDINKSNVLIAAGFHGDEPAGCWAILKYLQLVGNNYFRSVNLSFLPLVNPTGFKARTLCNIYKENPALGYCPPSNDPLSSEGEILMQNIDWLSLLALDGFISLHENSDIKDYFYLYTFEKSEVPGEFTQALLSAGTQNYKKMKDCEIEGSIIRDGVAFNEHDGTFENLMFVRGAPLCACTETPGQNNINDRVEVNRQIIKSVANYFAT